MAAASSMESLVFTPTPVVWSDGDDTTVFGRAPRRMGGAADRAPQAARAFAFFRFANSRRRRRSETQFDASTQSMSLRSSSMNWVRRSVYDSANVNAPTTQLARQ